MTSPNNISRFLDEILDDWKTTKNQFPKNTCPDSQWPIPFFGNPATAMVATVGVNPSSGEFALKRRWASVKTPKQWKVRLRDYFRHKVPPHAWFDPWRTGLAVLGLGYEDGSAVHIDLSFRATTAMLKNSNTDRDEFRRMLEYDSRHFFRLLVHCPNLRLLLTFGPVLRKAPGRPESLFEYLFTAAITGDFQQINEQDSNKLLHIPSSRVYAVHNADTPGEKCITCRVVKNLLKNRNTLRTHLTQAPRPPSADPPFHGKGVAGP
jgi:hypothetical protein